MELCKEMHIHFTVQEREKMKTLYQEGWSSYRIAKEFPKNGKTPHHTTVLYHLGIVKQRERPAIIQEKRPRVYFKGKISITDHYEEIVRRSLSQKIERGKHGEIIKIEKQEVSIQKVKDFINNSSDQGI